MTWLAPTAEPHPDRCATSPERYGVLELVPFDEEHDEPPFVELLGVKPA